MAFRTMTRLQWSLPLVLLCGCPGDDTAGDGSSGGAETGSSGGTTQGVTTVTPTTADTTDGGTSSSSGAASDTEGTTTSGGTGSSSGGDGSSSGEGSSSGGSSSGGSSSSTTGSPGEPCEGDEVLLYEQAVGGPPPGAPAGVGVGGSIRSADDFDVDAGDECWCVTRVVLHGAYSQSALSGNLEVSFHEDDAGVPLNPPWAIEAGVPTDTDGVFDYTFTAPVVLPAATYWLAALPELPDIDMGIWFWLPTTGAFGSPWTMESSFPPFVPACENWASGIDCFPMIDGTDLAFEVHGVVDAGACI